MQRSDFQAISKIRCQEACVLLDAGCYPGAYYLTGYAVECALKACVAKQVKQYEFPDKKLVNKVFTHNLEELIGLAGLSTDLNRDMKSNSNLESNWNVIKDWSESARYELGITETDARALYSACAGQDGVLEWIERRW